MANGGHKPKPEQTPAAADQPAGKEPTRPKPRPKPGSAQK
jgi:hypothetical protein